jgi:hypothetical protein
MDALDDDDDDDDDYSDFLDDEWFMFWSSHEEVLEAIMMLSMRSWSSWRLQWCFLDDDGFYTHTHPRCSYEVCCFVRSLYYDLSLFLSLLIIVCCVRIRRCLGIHNFFFFFLSLCMLPLQACNMGEVYWGTLSIQFSFGDPQYSGVVLLWIASSSFLLALPFFRVETLWCTQKWTKVWYPYILWALQKECWAVWSRFDHQGPKFWSPHYRNISDLTEGSTWASAC